MLNIIPLDFLVKTVLLCTRTMFRGWDWFLFATCAAFAWARSGPAGVLLCGAVLLYLHRGQARLHVYPMLIMVPLAVMAFMRGSLDAQRILGVNGAVLAWLALAAGMGLSAFLEWGAPSDAKLPPPSGPYVPIEASVFLDHHDTSNMVRVYYPSDREEVELHALPHAPYLHNGWATAAGFGALMKMPSVLFSWVEGIQSLFLSIDTAQSAPPPVGGLSPSTVALLLQGATASAAGDGGKGERDIASARRTMAAAVAAAADRETVAYAKRHAEEQEAPLPVVVFSHGLGGVPEIYSSFIADLVSHGWVVFAVEHRDGSAAFAATPEKNTQQSFISLAREQLANLPLLHRLRNKQLQVRASEVRSVLDLVSWLNLPEGERDIGIAADSVRAARQKQEKRADMRRRMRKEMGLPDEPAASPASGSSSAAAIADVGATDAPALTDAKAHDSDADDGNGSGAGAGSAAGAGAKGAASAGTKLTKSASASAGGGKAKAKADKSSSNGAEADAEAAAPPFNVNSSILAIASILGSRIDAGRVAVMGHSFGAATSIATADADRRPRAVIALDPWMFPLSLRTLRGGLHHVPTLGVCGDHFTQWRENAEAMRLLLAPWRRGAFVASDAGEYAAALQVWEERSAASAAGAAIAALPKGLRGDDDDDAHGSDSGVGGKGTGKGAKASGSFAAPPGVVVLPHHHHSNGVDKHGSIHPLFRCAPGSAPHPGNLLLTLRGSEHQNYNDFAVLGGKAIRAMKAAGPLDPVEGIAAIRALVRAFLVEHALRHPKPQQRAKVMNGSGSAAAGAAASAASAAASATASAAAAGAAATSHVLRDATLALLDTTPDAPTLRHLCRRAWLPPEAGAGADSLGAGSTPSGGSRSDMAAGQAPTH